MAVTTKKIRLGDMLVKEGLISEDQLMSALAEQKSTGHKLGRTLVTMGLVDESRLLTLLAEQLKVPFINLSTYDLRAEVVQTLPEVQARRYRVIVLEDNLDHCLVGMSDPTDIYAVDDIQNLLKKTVKVAVVRESDLLSAIDTIYRRTQEIQDLAGALDEELTDGDFTLDQLEDTADASNAPVVKLLRTLFEDAVKAKASDIHIEPDEKVMRIRQRIDGVLQEQVMNEKRIASALVLRLKLMAGLDISEKRLPQDGRFNFKVADSSIDVRLSTMPVQYGESVVMRLLDQSAALMTLEELGMPESLSKHFRRQVHSPHGMILVTGPTGSGKTTTLYAALNELNSATKKIITVEDPVEFVHESKKSIISQREVGPHTNSFAAALKGALRQDPDIILMGELRDYETVSMAMTAAETGHLVFGTLHTNGAPETINRIIDAYPAEEQPQARSQLSQSLRLVMTQQLLKRKGGGRIGAFEVMVNIPAVSNLIREAKIVQIQTIMQTGSQYGMVLMDKYIEMLQENDLIE